VDDHDLAGELGSGVVQVAEPTALDCADHHAAPTR
jgi:hypothetical protein